MAPALGQVSSGSGAGKSPLQLGTQRGRTRVWAATSMGTRATNRKPRFCRPIYTTVIVITAVLIAVYHFAGREISFATSSARRLLREELGGGMSEELRAELERLRAWHAESQKQEEALRAGASAALSSAEDLRDLRAELKERDRQLAKLRVKLLDSQKAFQRAVDEKAQLDMILQGDDRWGKAALSQEAMDKAAELLKECGKASGKMVADTNARIWKGYACAATEAEMKRYLDYEPRGLCPDDWLFVQDLIFTKNCFALPKRRCTNRTPFHKTEPLPLPSSLFNQTALHDGAVRWDQHLCKSFECLNSRLVGDCRNCFNLSMEHRRWRAKYRGSLTIEEVLQMKKGSLRIGLDVGGGTGSFAAHMALWNVTVLTTSFNLETVDGRHGGIPYMEAIALRGLVPLHLPHKARLPLFDNTLDLVHCINSIKYLSILEFEELLFEWDRVLRPGGIIWFEMFYAPVDEMPLYVSILDLLGYTRLYWNITPKPDSAEQKGVHVYLNCVIEKTARGDGGSGKELPSS